MIPYQAIHSVDILKHGICAPAVHIAQIFFIPHTLSMSSMIMNHTYIFMFCHIFHKRKISFLILTHSMNDLNDSPVFLITSKLRHQCQTGNYQSVCFWRKRILNRSCHYIPPLLSCRSPQHFLTCFYITKYIITQGVSQTVNLCYNRYRNIATTADIKEE